MAGHHQHPEDAAGDPDRRPDRQDDHDRAGVTPRRPGHQVLIPGVALVNDAGEPEVDRADQGREPHPRALREVAELVRQHARELLEVQTRRQRQADREHQLVVENRQRPGRAPGRGVHVAIDLDPTRPRRSDRLANSVHEGEHQGLDRRVELSRLRALPRAGEQRLDHEQGHHHARDQGTGVEQQGPVVFAVAVAVADVLEERVMLWPACQATA